MVHKSEYSEGQSSKAEKQEPMKFVNFGQAQTDAMLAMQKEVLDAFEEMRRAWLSRVKSEADYWSNMTAKMQDAHSLPDALGAYQQCVAERMKLAAEDGRRLLDDSQRTMSFVTRVISKGLPTSD
jgi:hypothetical protein